MPYVEDRIVHDADSHVMETPDWLMSLRRPPDPGPARALAPHRLQAGRRDVHRRASHSPSRPGGPLTSGSRAPDPQELERDGLVPEGRPPARARPPRLRAASSSSTPSFPITSSATSTAAISTSPTGRRAPTTARSSTSAPSDRRLLPVGFVPLADFARARAMAAEAVALGCKAILVSSACPPGHSPSHVGLFPVWEIAEEAGLPIVFHVGGGGHAHRSRATSRTVCRPCPDFHGGAENFRSVDFMAIPFPPMQTLAALIFDGVLDRFPRLKFGVIEQGAVWLPVAGCASSTRPSRRSPRTRSAFAALELRPSEYVRRQIRVTPYPTEPVGWIIEQAGEEVCLFSSDFPHVEGGRNPMRRFESTMRGVSASARSSASTATTSSTSWGAAWHDRRLQPDRRARARCASMVREFAEREVEPQAAEHDRTETFNLAALPPARRARPPRHHRPRAVRRRRHGRGRGGHRPRGAGRGRPGLHARATSRTRCCSSTTSTGTRATSSARATCRRVLPGERIGGMGMTRARGRHRRARHADDRACATATTTC